MPDGKINQYEWFGGTQSSNSKINRIGVLLPNPLGLHDMLGNVSEMTLDAFRLNKFDRQYGSAGSYVIRGSDYMQPESDLRAACAARAISMMRTARSRRRPWVSAG